MVGKLFSAKISDDDEVEVASLRAIICDRLAFTNGPNTRIHINRSTFALKQFLVRDIKKSEFSPEEKLLDKMEVF